MTASRWLLAAIEALAHALGPGVRLAATLTRPIARFSRYAQLSAWVDGHVHPSTQFDGPVQVPGRVSMCIGEHCRLGTDVFFQTNGGHIRLGSHVRINMGCVLVSYASITIGDNCLIGEYVSIRDANHGTAPTSPMRLQPHTSAPITIGHNVWIGRGAVVLRGVTVGDGAVIAANSVVTRDVAPGCLVAGAPARTVKAVG